MRLRYMVPALGLVSCTAVPAMAVEVNALTINGYVDSVLEFSDGDDAVRGDSATIDFSAAAQLEMTYAIGSDVSANIELYYEDNNDTTLEQAYISWGINEQVKVFAGKFHNSIGWEGLDAPSLYRVNNSHMYDSWSAGGSGFESSWGIDVTGAGVIIAATEKVEIGAFLVDSIYSDGTGTASDAIGVNAYATIGVPGIGTFDLDVMYGMEEATAFDAGAAADADAFGVDINGEIDALRDDHGLLFMFDINYVDYDTAAGMGILLGANYALPSRMPTYLSLFLNYVEPNDDLDDDESIEAAIALLTNPTDNEDFALNVELAYISREADDSDEFGVFVEALAVIP